MLSDRLESMHSSSCPAFKAYIRHGPLDQALVTQHWMPGLRQIGTAEVLRSIAFGISACNGNSNLLHTMETTQRRTSSQIHIGQTGPGVPTDLSCMHLMGLACNEHWACLHSVVNAQQHTLLFNHAHTLGFILQQTCLVPSSVRAAARHSQMAVLPAPAGPTSMMPCRTR